MALKVDYVARETTTNLWRNITLTIAAIVTIGVSLSLFGSAMLIQGGIDNLSTRWEDDVQVIVFVDRQATEEQQDNLESTIDDNPEVGDWDYVDQEESLEEFRRLFERNDAMLQRAEENPELMPTSYRIVPVTVEREAIRSLADVFRGQPGVLEVTSSVEGVEAVEQLSSSARRAIFIVAVGLLVAAILLIVNAIRMAMYARRREIEVMKLVGATNWFIRVPFMMEGVVQGVVGSAIAIGSVQLMDRFMERVGTSGDASVSILQGFVAPTGTVTWVMILMVILGVVIGALGSGLAISRFLRI